MMKQIFIQKIPILDFVFNITAMNIGTQKLLWYAHCIKEHRKSAANPHYITTKPIKLLQTGEKRQQKKDEKDKENLPAIFCRIPYADHLSNFHVKKHLQNN